MNQPQPSSAPKSNLKWLLIVLVIVIIGGGLYYYFGIYKGSETTVTASPMPTKSIATVSPSPKISPTSSPAKSPTELIYTNSKYGFTLTFPAAWEGYKMKETNIAGAEITYYVNVPTKDPNAGGDSTADAGYFSPFAISVYTIAQWNDIEASEGPHDTLITKNDTYAFGWSHANGVPPSDYNLDNDVAGIIASFKLL